MTVIIGIDPSTLGNNQVCYMDGIRNLVIEEVKYEGHAHTIIQIAKWVKKRRKTHNENDFKLCCEYQKNLLDLAVKILDIPVYYVYGRLLRKFAGALQMGSTKTDRVDARMVCHYFLTQGVLMKPYVLPSALVERARRVADWLIHLREKRTKAFQELWSLTHQVVPELRRLLGSRVHCIWYLNLLVGSFTKKKFAKMDQVTFKGLCKSHTLKDKQLEKLLVALKRLHEDRFVAEMVTEIASGLLDNNEREKKWLEYAAEIFMSWEGAKYLLSVKNMTPRTGVQLLASFGENWSELTPEQMSAFAGVVPEIHSSGTPTKNRLKEMTARERARYHPKTTMRRACNRKLKTVICLFARCTIKSGWAKEVYQSCKEKNQSQWTGLRKVSLRWIRILHALVTKKEMYDPEKHEKAREKWRKEFQRRQAS